MQPFPDEQWKPLSLDEGIRLLTGAPFAWAIAGGYAVEQFLGAPIRAHEDIDVMIFRDEQLAMQRWLDGWELYAADPPGTLRRWQDDEFLPFGVHDIWGFRRGADAWELQLMLTETDGDEWFCRRDARLRGQRDDLIVIYNGLPCVRIDVQLMYKSRGRRPKDEQDFQAALPLMSAEAKAWLKDSLHVLYPDGHPWLAAL